MNERANTNTKKNWMLVGKEGQVARVSRALYAANELSAWHLGTSTFGEREQAKECECAIRSYGKKDEETLQILDLRAASVAALQSQAFSGLAAVKEAVVAAENTVAQYRQDADAADLVSGAELLLNKKQETLRGMLESIQSGIGEITSVTIRRCGRQIKVVLEDTDWMMVKGVLPFTALQIGVVPYPENFGKKGWVQVLQSTDKDREDAGDPARACLIYSADNHQRMVYLVGYGNREDKVKNHVRAPENSVGIIIRLSGNEEAVVTISAKITDRLVARVAEATVAEGGRQRYEFLPDKLEAPVAEKKPAARKNEHLSHRPLEGLAAMIKTGDEKPVEVTAEATVTPEAPVTTTPEAVVAEAPAAEAPAENADGEHTAQVVEKAEAVPVKPPRKKRATKDIVAEAAGL